MADGLERKALDFTRMLSGLIGGSIAPDPGLRAVYNSSANQVFVGYKIDKTNLTSRESFPLSKKRGVPALRMEVSYRCSLDSSQRFLAVVSSVIVLHLESDIKGEPPQELVHFDYERDKRDSYPDAHTQVNASSPSWDRLLGPKRPLGKLHFPAGGRRYRTTLEDVIYFLINEKLVPGKNGWQRVIAAGRESFNEAQLAAAIRYQPSLAVEVLLDLANSGHLTSDDVDKLRSVPR